MRRCQGEHWATHYKECHSNHGGHWPDGTVENDWGAYEHWHPLEPGTEAAFMTKMWDPKLSQLVPRGTFSCQPRLLCHTADWRHFHETNSNFPPVEEEPISADGLVYQFEGALRHMNETTLESVGALLDAECVPTLVKANWVMQNLWDTPDVDTPLITYNLTEASPQKQPPTLVHMAAFISILEAVMNARQGLDWSVSPNPGPQNLMRDQKPHTSLVGEILSEMEKDWSSLVDDLSMSACPTSNQLWTLRAATHTLFLLCKGCPASPCNSLGMFVRTLMDLNFTRAEASLQSLQQNCTVTQLFEQGGRMRSSNRLVISYLSWWMWLIPLT